MSTKILEDAAMEARIPVARVPAGEFSKLLVRLAQQLNIDFSQRDPWDSESSPEGVQRPDGWREIAEYVGPRPCVVFLKDRDAALRFQSGSGLLRALEGSPAFEYYVCDDSCTWLLCNNHHDYVIGWGSAEDWVGELDA